MRRREPAETASSEPATPATPDRRAVVAWIPEIPRPVSAAPPPLRVGTTEIPGLAAHGEEPR